MSRFLSRAVNEDQLKENPYKWVRKLQERTEEREFLEIDEAAALLEAAQEMVNDSRSRCYYALYEIIAAFLLTGGRKMEVLGLTISAIRTICFSPATPAACSPTCARRWTR